MHLTKVAETVIPKRLLLRKNGEIVEDVNGMITRVADYVATADALYGTTPNGVEHTARQFYHIMDQQLFMPNSPAFTGADTPIGQLSACFVLPVADTLGEWGKEKDAIYDTMKAAALIHRTGGGTGFNFSRLRAEGALVQRTGRESSGPISFLKAYNGSTEAIKQGGTRRGANMGILRIDHPDILKFVHCKDDTTQITNFNISVGTTDIFEKALNDGRELLVSLGEWEDLLNSNTPDWGHIFDVLGNKDMYCLYHPENHTPARYEHAVHVYWHIVRAAWATGEPGLFRIDEANRRNPNGDGSTYTHVTPEGEFKTMMGDTLKEAIEATNPCGEQPLPPYGSCNLGSINLAQFVLNPYTIDAVVDWVRLRQVTHISVHFLDNIIDLNNLPLPEVKAKALGDRRIGLGVMGWAEMLVQLGVSYDSPKGCTVAREVMSFIKKEALTKSIDLVEERGAYPEWEGSLWHKAGLKVRNATLTTIAPTGTISIIAAKPDMPVSGGCEPKFALVFIRNQAGEEMLDIDGQFLTVAKREGWYSEQLMREIAEHGGVLSTWGEWRESQGMPHTIPTHWRNIFVCANEIAPEWHVRMQAAFQGNSEDSTLSTPIDSACSKTINFPNSATVSDVDKAYNLAFQLGLKGITVYRDGSRSGQVLTGGTKKSEPATPAQQTPTLMPRPSHAVGLMFRIPTHFGNMTIDIHEDPSTGEPMEFIVNVGATGSDLMADAVSIGMLGSVILRMRSDVPAMERLQIIVDKLKGIGTTSSYGFGPNKVTSLGSAVALGLTRYMEFKQPSNKHDHSHYFVSMDGIVGGIQADLCPECGNFTFVKSECACKSCGFSMCK